MVAQASRTPWTFVPVMYLLQAMPVSLVQDVSTVLYKDLGVANEPIVRWTTLVALPWSFQMFFGPLVDLSGTRRAWVVRAQLAIAAAFVLIPFLLHLPNAFGLSLGAMLVAATASTICNAAQDGYYLLSLSKRDQAGFAGLQGTCYKLGTLFMKGLLVFLAGKLMMFSSVQLTPSSGGLAFSVEKDHVNQRVVLPSARLTVSGDSLTNEAGDPLDPPIVLHLDPDTKEVGIRRDGTVEVKGRPVGHLALAAGATLGADEVISAPLTRRNAWLAVLFLGALVYGGLYLLERRTMPYPEADVPADEPPGELAHNVRRTLYVLGLGLSGYFAANALVRLGANELWALDGGAVGGRLKGWHLPEDGSILGIVVPGSGLNAEAVQLVLSGALAVGFFLYARRSIRGSAMGTAFSSFFAQSGIVPILAFLMFYRFGEAMIGKISPLFLKDAATAGGLGLSTAQVGTIKGVVGVFGIVLGGLLGGWIVSRWGLRRSVWPLAILMHLPALLYLWASHALPGAGPMYGVDFMEQFGYGFGYAGYTIVLQRIAQRGHFRTAHYALGVGVGALFSQVAGLSGGVLQANFGYTGFFLAAILVALPGLATLLFLPVDEA